jgi:hypothetical protein
MNKLSKKELEQKLGGYKKAYPKNEVFYATEDGNIFLEKNKREAESHANTHKIKLFTFGESSSQEDTDEKDEALEDLKAQYKELTGKAAHHTWDAEKIREKMEEVKSSEDGNAGDNDTKKDTE